MVCGGEVTTFLLHCLLQAGVPNWSLLLIAPDPGCSVLGAAWAERVGTCTPFKQYFGWNALSMLGCCAGRGGALVTVTEWGGDPVANKILNGTAPPGPADGTDTDFWIDTVAWKIYGPKAGGVWPAGVSMIGPGGTPGTPGTPGAPGPSNVIRESSGPTDLAVGAIADGTALRRVGGTVIGKAGTAIAAYLPATQTLTAGSGNVPINFTTETFDTLNEWDAAALTFTPQETGFYYIDVHLLQNAAGVRQVVSLTQGGTIVVNLADGNWIAVVGSSIQALSGGLPYQIKVIPAVNGSLTPGAAVTYMRIKRVLI